MYQKQHMNTTPLETSLIIYISFCKLQQQCAPKPIQQCHINAYIH